MENKDSLSYEEALKILSVAEVRVLGLVEKGYTSSEIADKLGNSKRTIQTHKQNICRKIGVTGRLGLQKWLWEVRNVEKGERD
jgi:DNA-binding CsgD family transcriptional regulator